MAHHQYKYVYVACMMEDGMDSIVIHNSAATSYKITVHITPYQLTWIYGYLTTFIEEWNGSLLNKQDVSVNC